MHKRSFTLIELMIVVIIVGLLAAVAAPMMRNALLQSRRTEAIAAMGSIRTAEKIYYEQYSTYREVAAGSRSDDLNALSMRISDLDGIYYSNNCYSVWTASDSVITCIPTLSTAPKANDVNELSINIWMELGNGLVRYSSARP